MSDKKLILDVCSGGRMMWFDKLNPHALFLDCRDVEKGFVDQRPNFHVHPDMVMDFRNLKFPDKSFKMVVFDPPHLHSLGVNSYMAKKYGKLDKNTWREYIGSGFKECWRVLEDHGVLIFKWNSNDISVAEVLKIFPVRPLFGHTTNNKLHTHWCTFMKMEGQ